jgi:hypothetical protein
MLIVRQIMDIIPDCGAYKHKNVQFCFFAYYFFRKKKPDYMSSFLCSNNLKWGVVFHLVDIGHFVELLITN